MLKCWEENPSDRPTFAKLKGTMKEMERNHMVSMGYNGDKRVFNLRATLPKILISNFHPEIDFAHNSSINFTWQVGNNYEIISEKLNFFKIF